MVKQDEFVVNPSKEPLSAACENVSKLKYCKCMTDYRTRECKSACPKPFLKCTTPVTLTSRMTHIFHVEKWKFFFNVKRWSKLRLLIILEDVNPNLSHV